jgi:hypothetical protein
MTRLWRPFESESMKRTKPTSTNCGTLDRLEELNRGTIVNEVELLNTLNQYLRSTT